MYRQCDKTHHVDPSLAYFPISGGRVRLSCGQRRRLGPRAAWATSETWNRFAPMVFMMAARTLGSESEADDIVQEVFYRLFLRAKTLREPDSLRSFVVSFAIRILRWELRRKRTRSWLLFQDPELSVDVACGTLEVESRDILQRFYGYLSRLAARDRLVFSLRHLESMTVHEVAAATKLSPSTVKRSLGRANRKLSRWIGTDPDMASLLDGKGWNR
jgi:RNA polymerase sigma factor (sigma-70 family)